MHFNVATSARLAECKRTADFADVFPWSKKPKLDNIVDTNPFNFGFCPFASQFPHKVVLDGMSPDSGLDEDYSPTNDGVMKKQNSIKQVCFNLPKKKLTTVNFDVFTLNGSNDSEEEMEVENTATNSHVKCFTDTMSEKCVVRGNFISEKSADTSRKIDCISRNSYCKSRKSDFISRNYKFSYSRDKITHHKDIYSLGKDSYTSQGNDFYSLHTSNDYSSQGGDNCRSYISNACSSRGGEDHRSYSSNACSSQGRDNYHSHSLDDFSTHSSDNYSSRGSDKHRSNSSDDYSSRGQGKYHSYNSDYYSSRARDKHRSNSSDDYSSRCRDKHRSNSSDDYSSRCRDKHRSNSSDDYSSRCRDKNCSNSSDDYSSRGRDEHRSNSSDDYSSRCRDKNRSNSSDDYSSRGRDKHCSNSSDDYSTNSSDDCSYTRSSDPTDRSGSQPGKRKVKHHSGRNFTKFTKHEKIAQKRKLKENYLQQVKRFVPHKRRMVADESVKVKVKNASPEPVIPFLKDGDNAPADVFSCVLGEEAINEIFNTNIFKSMEIGEDKTLSDMNIHSLDIEAEPNDIVSIKVEDPRCRSSLYSVLRNVSYQWMPYFAMKDLTNNSIKCSKEVTIAYEYNKSFEYSQRLFKLCDTNEVCQYVGSPNGMFHGKVLKDSFGEPGYVIALTNFDFLKFRL